MSSGRRSPFCYELKASLRGGRSVPVGQRCTACNGVPAEKNTVLRHGGLPQTAEADEPEAKRLPVSAWPLRIAFLGRLHQTKGPDILVHALHALPEVSMELQVLQVNTVHQAPDYLIKKAYARS